MKKLLAIAALSWALTCSRAFGDAGFTNTAGTGYCADETSSTFPAECATKPTAAVDGTVLDITQAINDQTAGAFTFAINGAGQTINVISGPTNAPTLFQAGSQWRLGATADSQPLQGNHAAASGQKTMIVIAVTGANTTTPIRATAVSTGTSNAPICPTTSSINQGDLVLRKASWHDDGDQSAVTRVGGSHTAGPLHQPAAANGKAIMIDYYVASGSGAPGTATFGIAASRPWVCETTVYATASAVASPLLKILQQH